MRMREMIPGLLALCFLGMIAVTAPAQATPPLGEGNGFFAALHDGEGHVDFRYRFEYVDQDGLSESAQVSTLRTAVSYQTMQYRDFDYYVELTNVADVWSADQNPADTPVVSDPLISRVNQSWLRWSHEDGSVIGGRQELLYDNVRFVGNVGWRQTHQVFDAIRADWTFADKLDVRYTFIGQVHRINGSMDELAGHAVNAGFDLENLGRISGYAYMWDFKAASNYSRSTNTFGGFWTGAYDVSETFGLDWRAEYAIQKDAYDNPNTVDESYMHFMVGGGIELINVKVGFEQLSGTVGEGRFETEFATKHAWNGWADKFLSTPDAGLNDLYVSAGGKWEKIGYTFVWHSFDAVDTDDAYGTEVDAQATYKFDWGQLVGLKAAFYSADTWATDTTKMWAFTTFTF